tara:strand:+ start:22205 stop:22900 length:696 start_codon:yes stop_codon:yes gene_type:complete
VRKNPNILFTGLTGNLGRKLIPYLIRKNYKIFTIYKYEKELKLINKLYIKQINYIKCDLNIEKDSLKIIKILEKKDIAIDAIVNLVGGFIYKDLKNSKNEDFIKMMNINFFSILNISRLSMKILSNSKNKSIINILSPYAEAPVNGVSAYAASKAALMSLSKSMAIEYQEYDIRVNCIMSDTIDTEINRKEMPNENFSKWIKPVQIFNAIELLTSEKSKFINGEIIRLKNE